MKYVLKHVGDKRVHSRQEIISSLRKTFGIGKEEYDQYLPSGNARIFDDRLSWAILSLKSKGFIRKPSRGKVSITEDGMEELKQNPIPDFVKKGNDTEGPPVIDDYIQKYDIQSIVKAECFVEEQDLKQMIKQLEYKKNLILQGPPGTGKTWLAKKLAFALVKSEESRVTHIQFHSAYSYEDFIRGYRPTKNSKLDLVDGVFLKFANKAKNNENHNYVCVIEEINRGNPANIFGEFLTFLEADKRGQQISPIYRNDPDEKISLPDNLYIIGTMNLADKSLAMMDVALRRRFAFVNLKPSFGKTWRKVCKNYGVNDNDFLKRVKDALDKTNEQIKKDVNLGEQYCIGHSFVTPHKKVNNHKEWYEGVKENEIIPLLEEYWFDRMDEKDDENQSRLQTAKAILDKPLKPQRSADSNE